MRTPLEKIVALNNSQVGKIHSSITFQDGKLTIQLQVGHPKEKGSIAGCFPIHLLEAIIALFEHYQTIIPCKETEQTILKLSEAWLWCKKREWDREKRGVLQTDKP
jgi:hypothetical protein